MSFRFSMLHGKQKKNASHAAWEGQTLLLRHLSGGKVDVTNDEIFVVVDFGGFGVEQYASSLGVCSKS